MNNIIKYLNTELPKINSTINNINAGGCGVFASILGERLEKLGFKPKYVLLTSKSYNKVNYGRKYIKDNKDVKIWELDEYITASHVVVSLSGYYIDSSGCHKIGKEDWYCDKKRLKKGIDINLDTLKRFCDDESYWNTEFAKYKIVKKYKVSRIKSKLDKLFKNYDKTRNSK